MLIALLDKRIELESENEAEIIDFIREVMSRRLYLEMGAESMFDFLTRAHYHYAPVVAQRKLDAAKLMQAFPHIKSWIAADEVNLTQLGMLSTGLRQNPTSLKIQEEILEEMREQTVKNTQAIICEKLGIEVKAHTKTRFQRDGSVRVELTFAKEQWEDITRATEVLSHSVPSGELSEVLTACARFTVEKKDPAASVREVKVRHSRGVSRTARRFVFQRDKSCRHVHEDGRVCGSRYQLQVDHIQAQWNGGVHEIENLQLLCGVHNRYKYQREMERAMDIILHQN